LAVSLWASQAEQTVLDTLRWSRLSALSTFHAEMEMRLDFYDGLQSSYVKDEMKGVFPNTYKLIRAETFPKMTSRIVQDTAQVYWQAPTRTLVDANGNELAPDSAPSKRWADIVSRGMLDSICREVNRTARLFRTEFLWIRYDQNADMLNYQLVHPQSIYVVESEAHPGDITRADLVVIPVVQREATAAVTSVDARQYWALTPFDAVRFVGYIDSTGNVEVMKVLEGPLPTPQPLLGRIPIIAAHDANVRGRLFADLDGGVTLSNSIVDMNMTADLALTDLRHLIRRQAAGQLIWNSASKLPSNLVVSADTILHNRDTSGSITFASPGAQINAVLDELKWLVKTLTSMERLSPGTFATERHELSGYALMLENLPLVRFTSEQQQHYGETFERDLFEMSRLVLNAYSRSKLPDQVTQRVKFVSLEYPSDAAAEWAVDKEKLQAGILSPIDLIMKDNPGMTREEAQAKYEENKAFMPQQTARTGLASRLLGGKGKQQ